MEGSIFKKLTVYIRRRSATYVACIVIVLLLWGTGLKIQQFATPTDAEPVAISGPTLPAAEPVSILIPKLAIAADFEAPLGLLSNQEIAVPDEYDTVGWYKHGPTPGELGPAVVLGHVDSVDGPAVFYGLGQLEVDDEIVIARNDGSIATFTVTKLQRNNQSTFPTEAVYGDIDHAGLRLITCSGTYDQVQQRYSHNLIVFARLVEGSQDEI